MRDRPAGRRAWITSDPIDPAEILRSVGAAEDGASVLFTGIVRDHNEGRAVSGLRYEAYVEMAEDVLHEIAREAQSLSGTDRIAVVHRTGDLKVGEVSVVIAASAPHRAEAYDASRHIIEEIKKRLPIWKKEHYVDGPAEWVAGARPSPAPAGKDERP